MNKFFVLLNVSLRSMLLSSTNSRGRSKRKAATGLGAVFLIAFLGLYLSGLYSYMLMKALAPSNMEVLVFVFMGMVALVGGLLFTTFAVKGVVFGGKDNDLLLSMPVPTTMLMASRVTAIYLENLLFAVFVLVPAGVICTFLTQNGVGLSLLFWMRLGLAVLALPLLDTALSVLLGALVAFLSVPRVYNCSVRTAQQKQSRPDGIHGQGPLPPGQKGTRSTGQRPAAVSSLP